MLTEVKDVKVKGEVVDSIEVAIAENWKEAEEIAGSKEIALAWFNYGSTVKKMNAARTRAGLKAQGGVPKSIFNMLGGDMEKIEKFKELVGL